MNAQEQKEGNGLENPFGLDNDGDTAIAFVNRFDLADKHSGSHCGEYRIIFAKNSGFTRKEERNLIIFEALVGTLVLIRPTPMRPSPTKIISPAPSPS